MKCVHIRMLSIFSVVVLLPMSTSFAADRGTIAEEYARNQNAFVEFVCEYSYTLASAKSEADIKSGVLLPYEAFRTSSVVQNPSSIPACTYINWAHSGNTNKFSERLAGDVSADDIRSRKITWTCGQNIDELFSDKAGIAIEGFVNGGGMWEGARVKRNVRSPFDFVDATGADKSMTIPSLLTSSRFSDLSIEIAPEGNNEFGHRVQTFVASDNESGLEFKYVLMIDQGWLPEKIELFHRPSGRKVSTIYVFDRKYFEGVGWFPFKSVKIGYGKNEESFSIVEIVEVTEFEIRSPSADELSIKFPLRCAVHIQDEKDAQFINDVERKIDINDVNQLIEIVKRISAGEPRSKFWTSPEALMKSNNVGIDVPKRHQELELQRKQPWLWMALNVFCIMFCVTALYARKRFAQK